MKINKTATLLALAASLGVAKAQTVIDIGGSTAGRSAVHAQILALLENETYAFDGTGGASKATRAIYHGTIGGKTYTIRTYWAGSVNGFEDVREGTQQTELLDKSILGTSGGENITATKASASAETALEIGFSDIFASTVGQAATDVEDEVGVITFKWFANKGTTSFDNITTGLVRQLYSASEAPLSMFTGIPADAETTVYPIGRNNDSGSRGTAMAEGGYGNVLNVDQYTATVDNGAVTAVTPSGNAGYSSGSGIKPVMNATYADGVLIAYLGASDFAADGVALKWNGVEYSDAAIQNGEYTFWGYLHQNRMNTLTGDGLEFYNALKTGIEAAPGSGLLTIDSMNVARDADGAPVYNL